MIAWVIQGKRLEIPPELTAKVNNTYWYHLRTKTDILVFIWLVCSYEREMQQINLTCLGFPYNQLI